MKFENMYKQVLTEAKNAIKGNKEIAGAEKKFKLFVKNEADKIVQGVMNVVDQKVRTEVDAIDNGKNVRSPMVNWHRDYRQGDRSYTYFNNLAKQLTQKLNDDPDNRKLLKQRNDAMQRRDLVKKNREKSDINYNEFPSLAAFATNEIFHTDSMILQYAKDKLTSYFDDYVKNLQSEHGDDYKAYMNRNGSGNETEQQRRTAYVGLLRNEIKNRLETSKLEHLPSKKKESGNDPKAHDAKLDRTFKDAFGGVAINQFLSAFDHITKGAGLTGIDLEPTRGGTEIRTKDKPERAEHLKNSKENQSINYIPSPDQGEDDINISKSSRNFHKKLNYTKAVMKQYTDKLQRHGLSDEEETTRSKIQDQIDKFERGLTGIVLGKLHNNHIILSNDNMNKLVKQKIYKLNDNAEGFLTSEDAIELIRTVNKDESELNRIKKSKEPLDKAKAKFIDMLDFVKDSGIKAPRKEAAARSEATQKEVTKAENRKKRAEKRKSQKDINIKPGMTIKYTRLINPDDDKSDEEETVTGKVTSVDGDKVKVDNYKYVIKLDDIAK